MLESNLSMISVDIEQSSSSYGGAIFSEQSNVTVFGGIMQMNVASHKIHGPKRSVGGVGLFYGGNLKISSLVVKNNTAEYGGGLGLAHNVNASITNVEFSSNFAKEGGSGGAMLISEANVFVSSCSVHDNVVAAGGVGGAFVFYAKDYSNKILTPPVAVEHCIFIHVSSVETIRFIENTLFQSCMHIQRILSIFLILEYETPSLY